MPFQTAVFDRSGQRGGQGLSDPVWIALIAAGPGLLAATLGFLNKAGLDRAIVHLAATGTKVAETQAAVVQIKKQTDGMTERIATLAGAKGVLEGHAQGMADAGVVPVVMVPKPEVKRK